MTKFWYMLYGCYPFHWNTSAWWDFWRHNLIVSEKVHSHWPIVQTSRYFEQTQWLYIKLHRVNAYWLPILGAIFWGTVVQFELISVELLTFCSFPRLGYQIISNAAYRLYGRQQINVCTSSFCKRWDDAEPTWPELLKSHVEVPITRAFRHLIASQNLADAALGNASRIFMLCSLLVDCFCSVSFLFKSSWAHFTYCCTEWLIYWWYRMIYRTYCWGW